MVKRDWVKPGAVVIDCGNYLQIQQQMLILMQMQILLETPFTFPSPVPFCFVRMYHGPSGINAIPDPTKKSGQRLVGDVDYNEVTNSILSIAVGWRE